MVTLQKVKREPSEDQKGFQRQSKSLYLKVKLETQQVLEIIPCYTGK